MSRTSKLSALFLVLFLLFAGYQSSDTAEIPDIVYFIYAANGNFGTGVMTKDGYVLTVSHIDHEKELYVSKEVTLATRADKKAVIVKQDKEKDLMLLQISSGKGTVELADPKLDEEVVVIGYPLGTRMVSHGRIMAIKSDILFLDTHCLAGASGSPVFNKNGKLVGLLQVEITDGNGMINGARSSKAIRKFLEKINENEDKKKKKKTRIKTTPLARVFAFYFLSWYY